MRSETIQPPGWKPAKGYSNGILVENAGRLLFIAGQIAWDADQNLVGGDKFSAQFERALENVVTVVRQSGGAPEHLVRLTIYVKDKQQYEAELAEVGAAYWKVMGRHYPAMALVQVADLLEPGALVEIEGTAALP